MTTYGQNLRFVSIADIVPVNNYDVGAVKLSLCICRQVQHLGLTRKYNQLVRMHHQCIFLKIICVTL